MKFFFIFLIKKYIQISPKKYRGRCVFTPSCSIYSLEAFKKYGTIGGIYLTLSRLKRCTSRNSGEDLVPDKLNFYLPKWLRYI
tara:strand:- start:1498 stop:1746 length:249 start_codon:yes stop_codon:yes gene_type:complete